MTRSFILCALLLCMALPACVAVDGSTKNSARPTAGQELMDLKTALDKGAISREEYEQKKAQILAQK